MNKHVLPLNLQLFADGGEPAPDPQGNTTPEPTNNPAAPQTTDQLVQTLLHASGQCPHPARDWVARLRSC